MFPIILDLKKWGKELQSNTKDRMTNVTISIDVERRRDNKLKLN